jgi:hypothetical protein
MKRIADGELNRKTGEYKKVKLDFNPEKESLKALQDRARHLGFSYWPKHWKKTEFVTFWQYVLAMVETEDVCDRVDVLRIEESLTSLFVEISFLLFCLVFRFLSLLTEQVSLAMIHDPLLPQSLDVQLCNPYTKPGGVTYFGDAVDVYVKNDDVADVPHALLWPEVSEPSMDSRIVPRHVRFCLERDYYDTGHYCATKPDGYVVYQVPHGQGKIVRGKQRTGPVVWEGKWRYGKRVEADKEEKERKEEQEGKEEKGNRSSAKVDAESESTTTASSTAKV